MYTNKLAAKWINPASGNAPYLPSKKFYRRSGQVLFWQTDIFAKTYLSGHITKIPGTCHANTGNLFVCLYLRLFFRFATVASCYDLPCFHSNPQNHFTCKSQREPSLALFTCRANRSFNPPPYRRLRRYRPSRYRGRLQKRKYRR